MNNENALFNMRHTASHVMSYAIKMLRPDVKMGVGPATEMGFYQDYDFGQTPLSVDDFKAIEKKMRWIVNKDFALQKREISVAEAKELFAGDPFKMALIEGIEKKGEACTLYDFVDGEGNARYTDLCAGPHVASTGQIGTFKLMKVAGAYWRGDENEPMLTRVYGGTFADADGLAAHLHMLEEAAKRDHRKLGKELDLYTTSDLIGSGLPLFTPRGTVVRDAIQDEIMKLQYAHGYRRVAIPHICKKDLYETSGHWQKYKDDLFHVHGKGDTEFVMKPMNCPHHTQIYASQMRSYRDLPIRYCEVTACYRDEQPGELLGLSRVRALTQDDGHVFCRMGQIKDEAAKIIDIARAFHTKTGMWAEGNFEVYLSVRDPEKPEKYLGDSANWDIAEQLLEEVAAEAGLKVKREEGEAAFYGPKLDFQFADAIGRKWQLTTIQLDFVMPDRFDLTYINEAGEKERPVMIHRAIAGSLERFMAVLIEHYAGAFPAWMAPVQAVLLPVGQQHDAFTDDLQKQLMTAGVRAEIDVPTETLGKRIRASQKAKVPFSIIIGDTETGGGPLTVRRYGAQKDEQMTVEELISALA